MVDAIDNSNNHGDDFVERVLAYLEGRLPDTAISDLERDLTASREKQQIFVDTCLHAKLLSESPGDRRRANQPAKTGDRGAKPDLVALDEFDATDWRQWARDASRLQPSPGGRQDRSGARMAWLAVAAAVVVCATIGLWWSGQGIATVAEFSGEVTVIRAGARQSLRPAMRLQSGDTLHTTDGGTLAIAYDDGTTLQLTGNTEIQIVEEPMAGKRVVARRGRVRANVVAQPAERPMVFRSLDAKATVLGTRLNFVVESGNTLLQVDEGKVDFRRGLAEKPVLVATGQIAQAESKRGITLDHGQWPADRRGLVFLFNSSEHPLTLYHGDDSPGSYALESAGDAKFDQDGSMQLRQGMFTAAGADSTLRSRCRATGELTVSAFVRPEQVQQQHEVRIVTMSRHSHAMNFMLGQRGWNLVFRLATDRVGRGDWQQWRLGEVEMGRWQHIAVTYQPGRLNVYHDGKRVFQADISGGFQDWQQLPLSFGDDEEGDRAWEGKLRGVAIYCRALNAEQVAELAEDYPIDDAGE